MNDAYYLNAPDPTRDSHNLNPTGEICLPLCHRTLTQDLVGDFSLPDYQPEIKRLLRITAHPAPPETFSSGDALEMEGRIDYFVLYMGNDNQLYCAPLSSEYRMTLPMTDIADRDSSYASHLDVLTGQEPTCLCDLSADPVTGRVTAPRRLNIKCRLSAAVKSYGQASIGAHRGEDLLPPSVETLTAAIKSGTVYHTLGELMTLQDDMILTSAGEQEMRVVCAEGQVMVSEISAGRDMVTCRGDVLLKLTLSPAEGDNTPATVTTRKIPFSQALSLPGVTPDCNCRAVGSCRDMSVEMEDGQLHSELDMQLEVVAQKNVSTLYEKDQFSTRKDTKCEYAEYRPEVALGCINGNFTLSDSLALADTGISPAARVVDVSGRAFPEMLTADAEKNRYLLTGVCRVTLILYKDGEYTASELELPFRYEKESYNENFPEGFAPAFDGCVKALTCRARMDGERIGIDAELSVSLRLTDTLSFKALRHVTFGEDIVRKRGEYVVCFPSAEDSLWSVAKRYHAPLAALGAANGLSLPAEADDEASLTGVPYLIV